MCALIIELILFIGNTFAISKKPFVMLQAMETSAVGKYLLTSKIHLSMLFSIPHYAKHTHTHTHTQTHPHTET